MTKLYYVNKIKQIENYLEKGIMTPMQYLYCMREVEQQCKKDYKITEKKEIEISHKIAESIEIHFYDKDEEYFRYDHELTDLDF